MPIITVAIGRTETEHLLMCAQNQALLDYSRDIIEPVRVRIQALYAIDPKEPETWAEIRQARVELERLNAVTLPPAKITPLQYLAHFLHDRNCHHNHTDGCGWYYDENWQGTTKRDWLEQAQQFEAALIDHGQLPIEFLNLVVKRDQLNEQIANIYGNVSHIDE